MKRGIYSWEMTVAKELEQIAKSRHDFLEALTLMVQDRLTAGAYFKAIGACARNFSDPVARYRIHRTAEGQTEALVIYFGQGEEQVGISLKPDLVCLFVPSTKTLIEQEGKLIYPPGQGINGSTKDVLCLSVDCGGGRKIEINLKVEQKAVSLGGYPIVKVRPTISFCS